MPIYAYKCAACGFDKDIIQKFSDAPLTKCPACESETFSKQLTAPAFQLKGSGWYVTDFRDGGQRKPAETANETQDGSKEGKTGEAVQSADGASKTESGAASQPSPASDASAAGAKSSTSNEAASNAAASPGHAPAPKSSKASTSTPAAN